MQSAQGVRSTTKGEIFKGTDGACADPDTRIFPATGAQNGIPAFQFYSNNFHVTHRFFVTFFTEESNVPPCFLRLPLVYPLPYTSTGTSVRRRRLYSPPNRTGRPVISRRARAYQRS